MTIEEKLKNKAPSDLFVEVRQRVAAFKYYQEFWNNAFYGKLSENEYLDEAYRFLNGSIDIEFLKFCAKKEGMDFSEYIDMLLEIN